MRTALALLAWLAAAGLAAAAPYALIDAEGKVREIRDFAAPPPALKAKEGVDWRPFTLIDPPFDPPTQIRTGPVRSILADRVEDVFTVRARTAGELAAFADDQKNAAVALISPAAITILRNHENRLRLLENQAFGTAKPPLSIAEVTAAIKALQP